MSSCWLAWNLSFRLLRVDLTKPTVTGLSPCSHEARERAFAQVDELLAEYSQWPFAKRTGGAAAIGANLDQVVRDEINAAKDKELQLEVWKLSIDGSPQDLTKSHRSSLRA